MNDIERRAQAVASRIAETGIDDAMIGELVQAFYAKVRVHPVLGPVFGTRVENWDDHMQRLTAFWSSVLLGTGAYRGSPMRKHLELPVDGRHFDTWLVLFGQTALELWPRPAVDYLMERAMRIAESIEMAIAGQNGLILGKGERLRRPDADIFIPPQD